MLGVKISDIFNALQSTIGSFYVNDFNVFGRTWQVNVQADAQFRDQINDIDHIYVRNAKGNMVPIRALAVAELVQGPQTVVRYNGYRAAIINGAAEAAASSGEALDAMERDLGIDASAPATATNGPAPRLQEKAASGRPASCSALRCCSLICSSSRYMKAGTSRSRLCCR